MLLIWNMAFVTFKNSVYLRRDQLMHNGQADFSRRYLERADTRDCHCLRVSNCTQQHALHAKTHAHKTAIRANHEWRNFHVCPLHELPNCQYDQHWHYGFVEGFPLDFTKGIRQAGLLRIKTLWNRHNGHFFCWKIEFCHPRKSRHAAFKHPIIVSLLGSWGIKSHDEDFLKK